VKTNPVLTTESSGLPVHLSDVFVTRYQVGGVLDFLSSADECFDSICKYARTAAYYLILYTPLILNVSFFRRLVFPVSIIQTSQLYLFLHQRMVSVCV
jgi:hypothetical protein